jgi:putative chitinase
VVNYNSFRALNFAGKNMVTEKALVKGYGLSAARAKQWAPIILEATSLANCLTGNRLAFFLAQIGHETGRLRWTNELWGPTKQQLQYERNFAYPWTPAKGTTNRLAYMLGNSIKGDGIKFRGHGGIQTTGRTNHRLCTLHLQSLIGVHVPNFEEHPELLAEPRWGMLGSASYWIRRDLNKYADRFDLAGQTKAINGGLNGLADRQLLLTNFLSLNALGEL